MANEDLNFIVGFEFSKKVLRDARKEVQRIFQDIDLGISTQAKRGIAKGPPKVIGKALNQTFPDVSSKLRAAEDKLEAAIERRVSNLQRISELENKGESLSKKEKKELEKLVRSKGGLTSAVNKAEAEFNLLSSALKAYERGIEAASQITRLSGTGLAKIKPEGLSIALSRMEVLAQRAANEFRGLVSGGDVNIGKAFSTVLTGLELGVRFSGKALERLGFTIADKDKLLAIAFDSFKERLGVTTKSLVAESLTREFDTLSVSLQPSATLLPKSLSGLEKMSLAATSSLARIKRQFDSVKISSGPLDGGSGVVSIEEDGRNLKQAFKRQTRILEEAVRATSPLADEFDAQIEAIQRNIISTGRVSQEQGKLLRTIVDARDALRTMSRPTEVLSKRVASLATRFSAELPNSLREFVNTNDRLKLMGISIESAKTALVKFGTDFEGIADEIIRQANLPVDRGGGGLGLGEEEQDEVRKGLVRTLTKALKREIEASNAITAENEALAKSKQRNSKIRTDIGEELLNEEQRKLAAKLKETIKQYENAGSESVRLGLRMKDMDGKLQEIIRKILSSVGGDSFETLALAPGGEGIANLMKQFEAKFKKDYIDAIDKNLTAEIKEIQKTVDLQKKITAAKDKILKKEQELVDTIDKQIKNDRAASGKKSGGATFSNIGQISSFGKSLDLNEQERFIAALKKQGTSIKEINAQVTSHNGNLAKSSAIVDKLTASMTTGQKAAFQFGFAAASAAERLLAWASPATFLFQAVGLLREATSNIIKLDSELRSAVAFSPQTVAIQIAAIEKLSDARKKQVATEEDAAESLIKNSSASVKVQAYNQALANSMTSVIDRSRQTGISIDELTKGIVAAARVGRAPFEGPDPSSFLRAVEAFKVLEGGAADTGRTVSLLNASLNQFKLSGESAVSVLAQVERAAAKSALEGQELLDVLVRTGGGFDVIADSTVPEALAVIQRAVEVNIPSISKLSTAIRQFTVLAVENAEEIKKFSGIELIKDGQIKDFSLFTKVLQDINKLAPAAREEFVSLFSERDTAATILSIASVSDKLAKDLENLKDPLKAAGIAADSTTELFEKARFKSESFSENIERLKASLASFIGASGIPELGNQLIKLATGVGDTFAFISSEIVNVFKVIAAVAAPTLFKMAQGFREGFLQQQNFTKVKNDILNSLSKELGGVEAVNRAATEGLITRGQAKKFADETVDIAAKIIPIDNKILQKEKEISILKKETGLAAGVLKKAEGELSNLQSQRNRLTQQELSLRERINAEALGGDAKRRILLNKLKGAALGGGAVLGFEFGSAILNGAVSEIYGNKEVGKKFGAAFESAIGGALTGAVFGGIGGAALGAGVGLIGSIVSQRAEAARIAKQEFEAQKERDKAATLAIQGINKREKERYESKLLVSRAEYELSVITSDIEKLEIEINRLGKERAEQMGLFNQRAELQTKLQSKQLQLRVRDQEKLEENIKYEKELVRIRETALTIEKAIGLQKEAQIGLAQSSQNERAQIQIEFDYDKAQLDNKLREIDKIITLTRSRLAILSAQGDKGNAQEIRRQEAELSRAESERKRGEFDYIRLRLNTLKKQEELEKKIVDDRVQKFGSASQAAATAFRSVIQSQIEIVRSIGQEADIFRQISDTIIDNQSISLSTQPGLTADERTAKQLELQRNALKVQLGRIEKIFTKQITELSAAKPIQEIESESAAFRKALNDANSGLGLFGDKLSANTKIQFSNLEAQRARFDAEVEATKARISIEREFIGKVVDIRKQEISAIKNQIDELKKRTEKEGELGRKLLEAPDEFLRELKNVNIAQAFFQNLPTGDGALKELDKRISRLQRGELGGPSTLLQVMQGLKSAIDLNISTLDGFSPEETFSVFSRLLLGGSDQIQKTLDKQDAMVSEIQRLNDDVTSRLNRQLELVNEDIIVQKALAEINSDQRKIAETQLGIISTMLKVDMDASSSAKKAYEDFANKILGIKIPDFDNTTGDKAIVSKVDEVKKVLEEIARFSPDVQEGRKRERALVDELGKLSVGAITKDVESIIGQDSRTVDRRNKFQESAFIENEKLQSALAKHALAVEKYSQVVLFNSDVRNGKFGKFDPENNFSDRTTNERLNQRELEAAREVEALDEEIKRASIALREFSRLANTVPEDVIKDAIEQRKKFIEEALTFMDSPFAPGGASTIGGSAPSGTKPSSEAMPAPISDLGAMNREFSSLFDEAVSLAGGKRKEIEQEVDRIINSDKSNSPSFVREIGQFIKQYQYITEKEFQDLNTYLRGVLDELKPSKPSVPTDRPAPSDSRSSSDTDSFLRKLEQYSQDSDRYGLIALQREIRNKFSPEEYKKIMDSYAERLESVLIQSSNRFGDIQYNIANPKELVDFLSGMKNLLEQQKELQLRIPEESIEKLKDGMQEAFDGLISRVESTRLNVDVADVSVQLDARVAQKIEGQDFVDQLAAAFQGTGLENKVDVIQGVVAKLVKTALDRGETFDGVDVVDFSGPRLT